MNPIILAAEGNKTKAGLPFYLYIILGVAALVVIILLIFLILHLRKKKAEKRSETKVKEEMETSTSTLADSFGGKENINEIRQTGSRVTVQVKAMEKVDQESIKKAVSSVLFMGNKIVLVIGSSSKTFEEMLEEKITK